MSVTGCACKRGFLVLRDCGLLAEYTCAECSRGVCAEHFTPEWNLCVDCAGRRDEARGLAEQQTDPSIRASREAAFERQRFWRRRQYDPFMGGWNSPYYDMYDVRSFDDNVDPWDGGDDGPSYLDS